MTSMRMLLALAAFALVGSAVGSYETVTVAIYEHSYISGTAKSRPEALAVIRQNLDVLGTQVKAAAAKGAKLFVFPEYGLTGSVPAEGAPTRQAFYPYVETIPQPNSRSACMNCSETAIGSETVQSLGCLATRYNVYLVANLIESVPCRHDNSSCPSDGHFQYNTNVVFNQSGCLIAKYHKYSLFMEEKTILDQPARPEMVYFDTEFGRFGTEVCFDLVHVDPGRSLVEKYRIDTLLFPTDWPVLQSDVAIISDIVQYSSGWARRYGVNVLAANIHDPKERTTGSAISSAHGVKAAYCNYTSAEGRLLVADIPMFTHNSRAANDRMMASNIKMADSFPSANNLSDYSAVPLGGTAGKLRVCQKNLCCHLEYERRGRQDDWYQLAAYVGSPLRLLADRVEMCVLRKCRTLDFRSCLEPTDLEAESTFTHLVLSGKFGYEYVYPTVSGAGLTYTGMEFEFERDSYANRLVGRNLTAPLMTAALVTWIPL